ncbi:DUF2267 domain-containing protein [Kitasatospora sp. RB6PN24]|uniref:DUF2267 domain-containing protein n=1 Tax=Kitasatospora humi TaxID=2893891 RepID=UPI001E3B2EFA|nr:DUF2267 domain-containing protein [Kitasatospora humi]MCC9305912.1 DUF2267 domain-containing protein [Kitasatospora humi]
MGVNTVDYPAFLASVRTAGGYEDNQGADQAVRTVLGVLGERLGAGSAENLAAQLPEPAAEYAVPEDDQQAAGWGIEEFLTRLADLGDTTVDEAAIDASAVLGTVAESIDGGELNAVLSRLPTGYADYFGHPELA